MEDEPVEQARIVAFAAYTLSRSILTALVQKGLLRPEDVSQLEEEAAQLTLDLLAAEYPERRDFGESVARLLLSDDVGAAWLAADSPDEPSL